MSQTAPPRRTIAAAEERNAPPSFLTRRSTLVMIRWLAIAGQSVTIALVHLAVAPLPLLPVGLTVAASVALNLLLTVVPGARRGVGETGIAWHIAFDLSQLAVLVALTGGLGNPFVLFLLAPVAIAAATVSVRAVAALALLALSALTLVALWHLPLPWPDSTIALPPLYRFAVWAALSVGILSVSLFTWRIAEEARRLAAAYSQSRLDLAQEQRVAEVGALAAAVAHELNTPLATVCLIARDMEAELRGSTLEDDIKTLIGQAARCRDTLARLTRGQEREQAVDSERISFPALVEMAAQAHADGNDAVILFDHLGLDGSPAPWIERNPAILHGLGNFTQNALQFANQQVEIDTSWRQDGTMSVRIADDGPGFPPHLLDRLGEPYLSGRDGQEDGHLGLGIFIATTLLTRTGASVGFANPPEGGAEILITWSAAHVR